MSRITYSAVGSVRGSCPHDHRTPLAAFKCAQRDNRSVKRGNGSSSYSDRTVVRSDGQPLTEREQDAIEAFVLRD